LGEKQERSKKFESCRVGKEADTQSALASAFKLLSKSVGNWIIGLFWRFFAFDYTEGDGMDARLRGHEELSLFTL
jgi:hypothetical protein